MDVAPVLASILGGIFLCQAKQQWNKSCAWSKNNAEKKYLQKGDKNRARAKCSSENVYARKAPKLISSKKRGKVAEVIYFKCVAILTEWKVIENIGDFSVQKHTESDKWKYLSPGAAKIVLRIYRPDQR